MLFIYKYTNMEKILKSTLKRQVPYLIGGTITGIVITYYYGFLFSIVVNSAVWFAISTVVNKYYWKYTGFKDEMYLVSKYVLHRKKQESANVGINKAGDRKEGNNGNTDSVPKNTWDERIDNLGRPIK
jgi:hypothetical protein